MNLDCKTGTCRVPRRRKSPDAFKLIDRPKSTVHYYAQHPLGRDMLTAPTAPLAVQEVQNHKDDYIRKQTYAIVRMERSVVAELQETTHGHEVQPVRSPVNKRPRKGGDL